MRRALVVAVMLGLVATVPARAQTEVLIHDAMGPLVDVTASWQDYQPSDDFCVTIDGFDIYTALSADPGPDCGTEGTFHVAVETPPLCEGCRRLFVDYAAIEPNDPAAGIFNAHGHVFFHLGGMNSGYTADPVDHSPNVKNFTNDKLVTPYGSPQEPIITGFDTYAIAYVGSTNRFTHSEIQGPYYVGPAYVNRAGDVINGAYVDVDVSGAQAGDPALTGIRYWVGFNSGEATCPDNLSEDYVDGNYLYYGCAMHPAISASVVDPFASA